MRMKKHWNVGLLLPLTISVSTIEAKPKPKAEAAPKPWDWQGQQHEFLSFNQFHRKEETPEFLPVPMKSSVSVGESAYLPCRVKNLGEFYTVSWLRARDVSVLSVGDAVFSSDERISVVQVDRPRLFASDWTLVIYNTTKEDAGTYECQVNTDPKLNKKSYLEVKKVKEVTGQQKDAPYNQSPSNPTKEYQRTHSIVKKQHKKEEIESDDGFSMYLHDDGCICPKPEFKQHMDEAIPEPSLTVDGKSVRYVTQGEDFHLTCTAEGHKGAKDNVVWKKDDQLLSGKTRGDMSTEIERLPYKTTNTVYLANVRIGDTGNYTCSSDMGLSKNVIVVALPGNFEKASSRQRRNPSSDTPGVPYVQKNLVFATLLITLINRL